MGPIWGRQDPGGPHIDPMNFDMWEDSQGESFVKIGSQNFMSSLKIQFSVNNFREAQGKLF